MSLLQTVTLLLLLAGADPYDPVWGAEAVTEAIELYPDGDPDELLAVALHESGFRPWAVGKAGETSMWQIHPVHRGRDWRLDCRTFRRNCAAWHVRVAVRELKKGRERCGNFRGALAHYNRGHGCKGRRKYVAGVLRELRYVRQLREGARK